MSPHTTRRRSSRIVWLIVCALLASGLWAAHSYLPAQAAPVAAAAGASSNRGGAERPAAQTTTGTITIVKEAIPESEQLFSFTSVLLGDFSLRDNGVNPNSRTFSDLPVSSYNIFESPVPAGWVITGITCRGGSDIQFGSDQVTIFLRAGENVTCTFTNRQEATPTPTPTNTPVPTATPTNTPTSTPVPPTATPTNTPTSTPVPPTATPTGFQGCTPDYWKQSQNFDSWTAPYDPTDLVKGIFNVNPYVSRGKLDLNGDGKDDTLLDALNYGDGSGTQGAARTLLRVAVAALLNAASPGVNYPYSESDVIGLVSGALSSKNRNTMLNMANQLNQCNIAGCPLN